MGVEGASRRAQTEGKVVTLNMRDHDGLAGAITRAPNAVMPGSIFPSPIPQLPDIEDNMVVCATFTSPVMPPGHQFVARILPGTRLPRPVRKGGAGAGALDAAAHSHGRAGAWLLPPPRS